MSEKKKVRCFETNSCMHKLKYLPHETESLVKGVHSCGTLTSWLSFSIFDETMQIFRAKKQNIFVKQLILNTCQNRDSSYLECYLGVSMSGTNLIGLQSSKDDKSLWNDHVPCTPKETRFSEQSNQTCVVKMLTKTWLCTIKRKMTPPVKFTLFLYFFYTQFN